MNKTKVKRKKGSRIKPIYNPVSFKKAMKTFDNGKHLGRIKQSEFALFYLTGARANEIMQLRKRDFSYTIDLNGREIIIVKMPTLKNQREKYRNLPLVNEKPYGKMIKTIEKHLNQFDDYQNIFGGKHYMTIWRHFKSFDLFESEAFLPKGKKLPSNVELIEKDEYDKNRMIVRRTWFPHYFRHCRLTHLVEYHHFDATRLMFWAGWTDTRLARVYIHLDWKSLADMIQKGQVPMNY